MLQIPLNQLKPAKNNVRQVKASKESLAHLKASIESQGLLHNLVVMKNGAGYHVIDGNRRLQALYAIYGKASSEKISCVPITKDDQEVGLHANMMREDMHPLDQCDVISKLCREGSEDFDSVAKRFGQTSKWVEQRVTLSELSPLAKKKFRNCDFNIGVAMALTLGSHDRQDAFLKENEGNRIVPDHAKRIMTQAKIPVSAALFPISKSYEANLEIEHDLFSDESFITNHEVFEHLQNEFIQKKCDELRSEGYADVIYLKDSFVWDSPEAKHLARLYDHDDVRLEDRTAVVRYTSHNYVLDIDTDYIARDLERQIEKEAIESGEIEAPVLTPTDYSKPQKALLDGYYLDHVRSMLFEKSDDEFLDKMSDAMLLARRIGGWTQYNDRIIGSVNIDHKNAFPANEEPENLTPTPSALYIKEWEDKYKTDHEESEISSTQFVMNMSKSDRTKLKFAYLVESISKYQAQDKEFIDITGLEPVNCTNWFKPDATWLNKYKIDQIEELYESLGIKAIGKMNPKKRDYIDAIVKHLDEKPDFNPFAEWVAKQDQAAA
tara:strand:+ start:976 stop:2625 length:1650 start_codon:yes stop_codon:yes gene_type:complete